MNERIKLLAEKADINIDSFQFSGTPIKYIVGESSLEKFAELIVKECVAVIKQNEGASLGISNFTDEKQQGIQLGLEFAICDIEEHFGVEE